MVNFICHFCGKKTRFGRRSGKIINHKVLVPKQNKGGRTGFVFCSHCHKRISKKGLVID